MSVQKEVPPHLAATATKQTKLRADQERHETDTAESLKISKNKRMKRWPRKLLKLPGFGLTPCKEIGKKIASLKPVVSKDYVTSSLILDIKFLQTPAAIIHYLPGN